MGKLAKNYIYNVCYQILVLLAPIITAPYLARTLGANYLGISNYVVTIAGIFTTIGMLGIQNYSIREIAYLRHDLKKLERVFYELYATRVVLCVVTLLCYIPYIFFSTYPILMWIELMYVVAFFVDPCWFYIGMEDMGKAVARNFMAKVANVVGIFLLIKQEQDYIKYVFLLSMMTLLASLLAIPHLWSYFDIKIARVSLSHIIDHIKGSLKLFWPQIATTVYLSVDKIMLEHFVSSSAVAYYDQAEKIVKIPLSFITVLNTVMMPRLANSFMEGNANRMEDDLSKTIRFSLLLAFPMMFGISGVISNLIPWYLGSEFLSVIQAVRVLSPIIVLCSMIGITGDQYLVAIRKTNIITISYCAAAISNIIIDFLFIPRYGIVGAAAGTIAAYGISLLIQLYAVLKKVKLHRDIVRALMYFFKSLPMYAVVTIMSYYMEARWTSTTLIVVVGVLLYGLTLLFSRDDVIKIYLKYIKNILRIKLNGLL